MLSNAIVNVHVCDNCGKPAYETQDGTYLCIDCMLEQVITKDNLIANKDVVLEFLRVHKDEFQQYVFDWYTK